MSNSLFNCFEMTHDGQMDRQTNGITTV